MIGFDFFFCISLFDWHIFESICTPFSCFRWVRFLGVSWGSVVRYVSLYVVSEFYCDSYAWLRAELCMEEDVCVLFFSALRGLSHRKAALTFLLRADLQQWSVNYGDFSIRGVFNQNPFQRSLRLQALHQLMCTNETRCEITRLTEF